MRTNVGVTDYPFLSHIAVTGSGAAALLRAGCTRDVERCAPGSSVYTLMLDADARVIDDGIVMRLTSECFIVSVPCRNPALLPPTTSFRDYRAAKPWLLMGARGSVGVHELGACLISIQGPRSRDALGSDVDLNGLGPFSLREVRVRGIPTICSRTGFSGELGFEFLVWPEYALELWQCLTDLGREAPAVPYGIEATIMLGIEKGYLNAGDFYPGSTPHELALGWAVDIDGADFVGRAAFLRRSDQRARTRLVGLELDEGAPVPQPGQTISAGAQIGAITNAAYSPTFGRPLARAWVDAHAAVAGTRVEILTGDTPTFATVAQGYRWYDPAGDRGRA